MFIEKSTYIYDDNVLAISGTDETKINTKLLLKHSLNDQICISHNKTQVEEDDETLIHSQN